MDSPVKIGLISDIHSNRAALKAVLKALAGVDMILCAGDLTGYYNDPNGVIADLIKQKVLFIKGNHDNYLESPPEKANQLLRDSISFTSSKILPEYKQLLKKTPTHLTINLEGLRISMYHGSPWDTLEEYIYPNYEHFEKFASVDADIIILGHTHHPFVRKTCGRQVINPGSCGQPRDRDVRASYAILDSKDVSVDLLRVNYNASQLIKSLSTFTFKKKLVKYLPHHDYPRPMDELFS